MEEKNITDLKEITDEELINEYIVQELDKDFFYNRHSLRIIEPPSLKNPGKRIVQTAGYIPLHERIENMVAAGMNLQAIKEEMYPGYMTEAELNEDDDYDPDDLDEIEIMERGERAKERLRRVDEARAGIMNNARLQWDEKTRRARWVKQKNQDGDTNFPRERQKSGRDPKMNTIIDSGDNHTPDSPDSQGISEDAL